MTAPVILLAAYDPGAFHAQWQLPGAAPAGLSGFRLDITGSGGFAAREEVGASSRSDMWDVTLTDLSQTYVFTVTVLINGAPGDTSLPVTLLTTALSLTGIVYDLDPDTLTLSWAPPKSGAEGGMATVTGGGGTHNGQGKNGTRIAVTLDPSDTYQITARAYADAGVVLGPTSPVYAPVILPLTLTAITYDLQPDIVTVSWVPPTGTATGGLATVAGDGATRNGTGTVGAKVRVTLDTTKIYQVTARGAAYDGLVMGPASDAYAPIADPLSLTEITYDTDPADVLTVGWGSLRGGADAGLATLVGGGAAHSQSGVSNAVFPGTLNSGTAYQITARPTSHDGLVQGPASPVYAPIIDPLDVTVISYDLSPDMLSAEWNPPPAPATGGNATLVTPTAVLNDSGTVSAVFSTTLDAAKAYSLTLRPSAHGGLVLGPASPAFTPIVEPLSLISLVYDVGQLTVQWTPPAAPAASGQATLTGPSILRYGEGKAGAPFAITLDPSLSYSVTFRPVSADGIVHGPVSEVFHPIAQPIALKSIVYDVTPSETLGVAWEAPAAPAAAGLAVLHTSSGVKSQTGTSAVSFATAVTTADTITARLIDSTGRIEGPASADHTPIMETTTISLVSYDLDPDLVTADWAPASATPNPAYRAELTPAGGTSQYATGSATTAQFPGTLPVGEDSSVRVRITDAADLVRGPQSAAVIPITEQPGGARLDYLTSDQFRGTWSAVTGYDGYLYRFDTGDTPGTPTASAGPNVTIDHAIAAGTAYAFRVRVKTANAQGPWSTPAPGPYLMSAQTEHDGLGRLTRFSATGFGDFVYSRDAFGNILSASFAPASGGRGE
ncbi:hypothetical protein AWH62_03105 [Maricaulis sp. W15]|uniref:hypothetical protein n=1 Tax=Maricaulis sp. W15 TaxID=1772333 RepID=UPI0009491365|nr:hypothetical protein [Maricaulis sp. W15]OLF77677.1 hypothetical protein AWH62_03105 [Maricaulis sp. W15]